MRRKLKCFFGDLGGKNFHINQKSQVFHKRKHLAMQVIFRFRSKTFQNTLGNVLDLTRGDAPERTSDLLFSNSVILALKHTFPQAGRPKPKSPIPRSQVTALVLNPAAGIPKSILKGRIDPERLDILLFWSA